MDLKGKKVLVVGLGKTGVSTVCFLARRGAKVAVTDEKPISGLKWAKAEIGDYFKNLEFREYDKSAGHGVDLIVPSPGVPPHNSILSEAIEKNIPILSEIELAWRFLKTPTIAVTGTNGKTTTTTMTGNIFIKEGKNVFVGGNIGFPLIGYVDGTQDAEYAVVEISSFQLQWIRHFRPFISVLLNITSDHIDYHGSFEAYRAAKEKIFENQTHSDHAIINADDPSSNPLAQKIPAQIHMFSSVRRLNEGIFIDDTKLLCKLESLGINEAYPLDMIKIPGRHNIENIMASIIAARLCGCSFDVVKSAIEDFKGIPHRIEFVCEKKGVRFYDDSKATNPGAVARAIEAFSQPLILLMGGRDKESDFSPLSSLINEKVKELILFGEARDRINQFIGGIVETSQFASLKEAAKEAYYRASSGDVVLLSPGCASFDEFSDYRERGRFFKDAVKHI